MIGGFKSTGGLTPIQETNLNSNTLARHTHSNSTILINTEASYTSAEKTKLGNLTDSFKGVYANASAISSAYASPSAGWSAWNTGTGTMYIVSSGSWINSGISSLGNMLQSVYDPQSISKDAFVLGNMTGSLSISKITNLSSASVDSSGNLILPANLTVSGIFNSPNGLLKSIITSGIYLASNVPSSTSNILYNNNGTLMFNGTALATGSSVSGTTNYLSKFTSSSSLGNSIIYETTSGYVGIGTTNPTAKLQINGPTKLGNGAPAIQMAYYTGTMGAVGTSITINHGLTQANILGVQTCVYASDGNLVQPSNNDSTWFEVYVTSSVITLYCGANASIIAGRTARILITYTA